MDSRPVGVFDSGVGGLSVVRHFRQLAPHERVVYFADTAFFPYGPRPPAEVRKRAFSVVQRLLKSDVKAVVVACNTASAAAIADLRDAFPVPFVGMVPGLKPAANASPNRHIAILATAGTLDGDLYARVAAEFGRDAKIENIPGEGLAEMVEAGGAGTPAAVDAVRRALTPAIDAGADTVVLGCTHYAFLEDDIRAAFPGASIIDTGEAVARRAVQVLAEAGLAAPDSQEGTLNLVISGDRASFRETVARLGFAPSPVEAAS